MGCVDCQWNRSGPGVIIRAEIRCGNPICARHQRLRESSFFISASLLKLNENYWLALPWRPAISLVKHQKNENALHQSEVQTQRDWHRPGNWIPVNKSSPETSSDAGRRHASNQSRQVRGMFYFVALTALDLFGVKRQFFFEKITRQVDVTWPRSLQLLPTVTEWTGKSVGSDQYPGYGSVSSSGLLLPQTPAPAEFYQSPIDLSTRTLRDTQRNLSRGLHPTTHRVSFNEFFFFFK